MEAQKKARATIDADHHPIETEEEQLHLTPKEELRLLRRYLRNMRAGRISTWHWVAHCPICRTGHRIVDIVFGPGNTRATVTGRCRECGRVFIGADKIEGADYE